MSAVRLSASQPSAQYSREEAVELVRGAHRRVCFRLVLIKAITRNCGWSRVINMLLWLKEEVGGPKRYTFLNYFYLILSIATYIFVVVPFIFPGVFPIITISIFTLIAGIVIGTLCLIFSMAWLTISVEDDKLVVKEGLWILTNKQRNIPFEIIKMVYGLTDDKSKKIYILLRGEIEYIEYEKRDFDDIPKLQTLLKEKTVSKEKFNETLVAQKKK